MANFIIIVINWNNKSTTGGAPPTTLHKVGENTEFWWCVAVIPCRLRQWLFFPSPGSFQDAFDPVWPRLWRSVEYLWHHIRLSMQWQKRMGTKLFEKTPDEIRTFSFTSRKSDEIRNFCFVIRKWFYLAQNRLIWMEILQ